MLVEGFAYPKVMRYFEEISAIPRGSYHEERIASYLEEFARARGLACYRDELGNVLINCDAAEGYEDKEPILMQGHTDMVCEKNEDVIHDFLKDPLELYVEEGWLRARGTTLGADNGVAVAVMLAILDGALAGHPALQCLFTVSEEVGLDGIKAFDLNRIYARKMLNMDSADENLIVVGCAGGMRSELTLPVRREPCAAPLWNLRLTGLAGGHSGEDIHRGRANAHKLMGRILYDWMAREPGLRLVSLRGGNKDNAIPREAEACVAALGGADGVAAMAEVLRGELCPEDGAFALEVSEAEPSELLPMDAESTQRVIFLAQTVTNGVISMCQDLPELVEFSRNMAVVKTEEEQVRVIFSSRSAKDSQIDRSAAELDAYAALLGGSTRHYNRYPGWSFEKESELREEYTAAYRKRFGREPGLEIIHAGLECGIVKEGIPDMDILSCGPVITDLHSPNEAVHLGSWERFFSVIKEMLEAK